MVNDPYNADPTEGPAPLDEQLVAYLDGELDDESSRQIEERLTTDSTLRDQLSRFERTWDALDQLEQVEVDEEFTRTTIEMLAFAAEEERHLEDRQRPARQRRQWLVGSVGLVAACLAGFTVAWSFWPDPNQELIEDLPVLERLDEYQQIDNIEFLKLLHDTHLFAAEDKDDNA
jgi:anti-sigma-K factor RskA